MDQIQTDNPGQAKVNASLIDCEIIKLRTMGVEAIDMGYKGFWAQSKQIIELFKTLKPLVAEDRQHLWTAYREICDEVHRQQVEHRDALRTSSNAVRTLIETDINEARAALGENPTAEQLAHAREALRTALQKMKGSGRHPQTGKPNTNQLPPEVVPLPQTDASAPVETYDALRPHEDTGTIGSHLLKDDREACWRQWQEVRQQLQTHLDATLAAITVGAASLASRAHSDNPPVVLKDIRDLQLQTSQLGLTKDQREQIRAILNEAWKTAIGRLQHIREERKAKHQEWRTRMEENLQRWHEQAERRGHSISHLREQVEKLESMLENARSDEHRDRVRSWLDETKDKLQKHEAAAVELHEKITSVEGKLKR